MSLDDQLCFALYSTMHSVAKSYAPLLADLKLTYPQYLVMLVLWDGDDVSVKTIGQKLFLDSGTLTPLLKRLAAMGLVERDRNAHDERLVMITLTDAGRALRTQAESVPSAMLCAMGITPERLGTLRAELMRLRAHLIDSRIEAA